MESTQGDRDALRLAQQKNSHPFTIGNLVEHKIQDPARYKTLSRLEQGIDPSAKLELPTVRYQSKFYENHGSRVPDNCDLQSLTPIPESEQNLDLPITSQDVQSNLWLNMDRVEFDKLEWMSEKAEKAYRDKLNSTTHFDAEGRALPPSDSSLDVEEQKGSSEIPSSKRNHDFKTDIQSLKSQVHDIDGLVRLMDSQFQPQVTYALRVVSKIALRATTGYYDGCFDENIHEVLIREFLLRVRHHLDSSNETICQNAIKCLKSLLCNTQIDEIFLDRMHPIMNEKMDDCLWLNDEMLEEQFEIDMKDSSCVQLDAILCLVVRTNLMARLEYLIKTKQGKFSNNYNDCLLDIIIRLARHSQGVCMVMYDAGFMDLIKDTYLPMNVTRLKEFDQSLAIRALKFIRIISQASMELNRKHRGTVNIKIPTDLLKILESYYYIDLNELKVESRILLMKIHIEALRLMKTLALMNNFTAQIHSIVSMSPNQLMDNFRTMGSRLKSVQIVESRISLDWQFAAHTIDLVGCLARYEIYRSKKTAIQMIWTNYARPITLSWITDLIKERFVPQLDVCIAIARAMSYLQRLSNNQDSQSALSVLLDTRLKVVEPKENASLIYFNHLIRMAEKTSQFSSVLEKDGRLRDPKMLPSYGCLNFNKAASYEYKINPIVDNNSPIILLEMFVNSLLLNQSEFKANVSEYVNNINTFRYVRCASRYLQGPKNYESFVQSSVFAQQEVYVMIMLMLMQVGYFTERRRDDEKFYFRSDDEPTEIAEKRQESYSNLILSAISIIGMVNSRTDYLTNLKDKLLEIAILDNDLHARLARENYKMWSSTNRPKYDLEYYNKFGLDEFGERTFIIMSEKDMQVLKPIYMSVLQPGRFWIFEPIIEYYKGLLKNDTDPLVVSDGRFLVSGINSQVGLKLPYEDTEIISSILRLHASVMHTSPAYNRDVLRPNVEEFLCIIGTVFLDSNLFLDDKISDALKMNLELIAAECNEQRRIFTNASRIIETLNLPLNDFFNKLVDQYEACSYGDNTFTNFLLLFMASNSDKLFKKKLFSEKVETCIGQMRLPLEQVWASSSLLFNDIEKDPEVRELIYRVGQHVYPGSFMQTYVRKQMTQKERQL